MPKALPIDRIESRIHLIRGVRAMLDADLAECYGVTTKALNQAVRRNLHRFPSDFAFRLDNKELTNLRSQFVTSSSVQNSTSPVHGGRRYLPWAFTEHGAVMLASILNSAVAISMSVEIVRSFVQMRQTLQLSVGDLAAKLAQIDLRLEGHDDALAQVAAALNNLLNPPPRTAKEIGFHVQEGAPGETIALDPKAPRKPVRYQPARRVRRKAHHS